MTNNANISFDSFWNIIDGQRRGSSFVSHGTNPATGKPLWDVPIATEQDVDEAVRAAQKAFPGWSATEYRTRVQLLNQFADAFLQFTSEFTALLQAETGRTVSESQLHTVPACSVLRIAGRANIADTYVRMMSLKLRPICLPFGCGILVSGGMKRMFAGRGKLTDVASLTLPHEEIQDEDKEVVIKYEPHGVVAAICPWNCKA